MKKHWGLKRIEQSNQINARILSRAFYGPKNIIHFQELVMFHKHIASSNFSKYVIKKICALILYISYTI